MRFYNYSKYLGMIAIAANLLAGVGLCEDPVAIAPNPSNGSGFQYELRDFDTQGGGLISKITKNSKVYTFSQTGNQSWVIRVDHNMVMTDYNFDFLNNEYMIPVRMVEIRESIERFDIVFRGPKEYFYFIIDRPEQEWALKAWVVIPQKEFNFGDKVDNSVTSIEIPEPGKFIIKRSNAPDAIYSVDLATKTIGGEGHGHNKAYFRGFRD